MERVTALSVGLCLVVAGLTACDSADAPHASATGTSPKPVTSSQKPASTNTHHQSASIRNRRPNDALVLLRRLRTQPERSAGYQRDEFAGWLDANGDGCDTRNEVLISESRKRVTTGAGCDLSGGRWFSAYDGQVFTDSSGLDIDHMVPLAEAWGSGAKRWTAATRDQYSNDLGYRYSLRAVSASSNRSKSDRDPAEWLPPRQQFRCEYAKEFVAVKYRWHLQVDPAERAALRTTIKSCRNRSILTPPRARIERRPSGGGGGGGGSGGGGSGGVGSGGGGTCSPHYSGACIPIRSDVDCSQIPDRNFHVVDVDIYGLDGDGNGVACET